eukprot:TRINITY_DN3140_c1_g1_i1.p1 TRINITY_DN3140_c1_g1~~TRINITY_DN3140_c1_g1_i1.p1  ORF type:complete len:106 (+),score=11.92 TRINITY_DN3140_c1_g1_i1:186-503(+)
MPKKRAAERRQKLKHQVYFMAGNHFTLMDIQNPRSLVSAVLFFQRTLLLVCWLHWMFPVMIHDRVIHVFLQRFIFDDCSWNDTYRIIQPNQENKISPQSAPCFLV